MTWYPSNNHPQDKATFSFEITVPEQFTVAATGLLVDEAVNDGLRVSQWELRHQTPTYLAAVYVGDFERHERLMGDGRLQRDYLPKSLADEERSRILDVLVQTEDIIIYFESVVGPYPYDAYGTIVMSQQIGFALENQTLSVHDPRAVRIDILAHEIAHHWFGNAVTAGDWGHTWLHEGFATYLEFLYLDHAGHLKLDEAMHKELRTAIDADAAPPGRVTHELMFDYNSTYRRGALALHALRTEIGDEAFFRLVRQFYENHRDATAVTADFASLVADIGGPEGIEVLVAWLYDIEMPTEFARSSGS